MTDPIRRNRMIHAISIDVEDWYQTTVDTDAELTRRFERSTYKVLEVLEARGVRATFFVLGLAAEKAPSLIRSIAEGDHEIQSHGYGHRSNFDLTPEELRRDLARAKGLLENLIGKPICAYRAPNFSIDRRNPWVFDTLVETGHLYDSSVFPVRTSRYGIDGFPPEPGIITSPKGYRLIEAPVACFDWLGGRLPVGGGGYMRLLPYWMIRKAWRHLERRGRPGIVYMHPYEYDPREMRHYADDVHWKTRLHQNLGRKGFPSKIERLITDFRFGRIKDVISGLLDELRSDPAFSRSSAFKDTL